MTILHEYTVHGAVREPVHVRAMMNGREVDATIPGLTVELVSATHGHTFRLEPGSDEEMAEAVAMFAPGAKVAAVFHQTAAALPDGFQAVPMPAAPLNVGAGAGVAQIVNTQNDGAGA